MCTHTYTVWLCATSPSLPFVLVLVCSIQCSGLGGMKPNCVLIAWPDSWRKKDSASTFMSEDGEGRREEERDKGMMGEDKGSGGESGEGMWEERSEV